MKKLSETYKELGIDFAFPIVIKDANGYQTYYEDSDGYWRRRERDAKCRSTYHKNSDDYWQMWERDANGDVTYYEDSAKNWHLVERDADGIETYYESSTGFKRGTPKSAKTCEGKVVEVDGN